MANVVAELMDPDETGSPKDEKIRHSMSAAKNAWLLGGGSTQAEE